MNIATYTPFVGQTIEEAIAGAVQLAKEENRKTMIVINDIVMFVNKNSNQKKVFNDYREKVSLRYRAAQIKRTL